MSNHFDTSWYVAQEAKIAAASRPKVGNYPGVSAGPLRRGYLYLVEFSTDVIKAGRTISPSQRIATHTRTARVHGVAVRRSWVSAEHPDCVRTEPQLLSACRQWGAEVEAGSEYFRDIPFDDAVELATQLAANQKRRTYLEDLIGAADNDLSMTWRAAHDRLPDPTLPLEAP